MTAKIAKILKKAKAIIPASIKKFISMFDISEPAANIIYNISNAILVAGGIAVAFATFTSIWTGGILGRATDAKLSKNVADTAIANATALTASAELSKTQLELSKSNERILELQEKLAFRDISPEQEAAFKKYVASFPKGKILITTINATEEISHFALRIGKVLNESGYNAPDRLPDNSQDFDKFIGRALNLDGSLCLTILVGDNWNKTAIGLAGGFKTIGIGFYTKIVDRLKPDEIEIWVGEKDSK